ncbi:hypothetical protein [Sphaerisporangium perillae]|nr:hypothetical protein [Sphaerisporangium perillae]
MTAKSRSEYERIVRPADFTAHLRKPKLQEITIWPAGVVEPSQRGC